MGWTRFSIVVAIGAFAVIGCDGEELADSGVTDGAVTDAGGDAATMDAGGVDAGDVDAGDTDAGDTDAGGTDAGDTDAGDTDAGGTDAGGTDAGGADAGGTDAGGTDAGGADAGGTDAGGTDAGMDAGMDAGFDAGFDAGPMDAGLDAGSPSTCPFPTVAEGATITVMGTVRQATTMGLMPVSGATFDVFDVGTTTPVLGTGTSTATGAYAATFPSGGAPRFVYGHVQATGQWDVYVHGPYPLNRSSESLDLLMMSGTFVSLIAGVASATQPAGRGFAYVEVRGCLGARIAGATVSSTPAGTVRYLRSGMPSATAADTDSTGTAVIFDLPPGPVTIHAMMGATTYSDFTVPVVADSITATYVIP
ncbi:MAG: hypothetical protein H6719_10145 [Sandaracinaceae bacterium]|nr:hypothetical protein [Sandaracinaceae bacterium]